MDTKRMDWHNDIFYHTLPNGLKAIHLAGNSTVSHCGYFVNAGTRDEQLHQWGMAHLVEHLLFKGTQKRRPHHIINRMETVGGELNAYTNKEETVIYSTFIEEYAERAIELLTDLTFCSTFPQKELEKEVEVVIDEINSYEDSPAELIYDEFENMLFEGNSLGHFILGTEEHLHKFDSRQVKEFVNEHYTTGQTVFFSMGKTPPKKIFRLLEKYAGNLPCNNTGKQRTPPAPLSGRQVCADKNTNQSHTLMGGYAYPIGHPLRPALMLLNNLLGGPGMNSRLNIALREKRGYVYTVEASLTPYSDTGVWSIYFGGDQRNQQRCIDLVQKELHLLCNRKLSTSQLAAAQKQYIGQMSISHSRQEDVALALGKSIYHLGQWKPLHQMVQSIQNLTADELLHVANEIFTPQHTFLLLYR